ncbi:MAG: serine/threonine-protein kinase [Verrucomicrobiota bacterium]
MSASNQPSDSRLREIFLQAVELTDAAQRQRFLDDVCAGDAAMRAQINDLLASHQDDSFLEHPAIQIESTPNSASGVTVSSSAEGPKGTIVVSQAVTAPGLGTMLRYFGDYELLDKIAQGGMGVVYKARQVKLNRLVAVKMILSGQLASETDIQRFLTEAEAAANLQHPNIVAIHEVGQHEGRHYFSMDYVEGKNLADYSKDNPLPAARAAQLIKTIAEAIHFAHQRGTLHRDLKPQNVLIDAAGQPRITDFGLAKLTRTDSSLTREGAVMGSPSYMSPEQAAGKNDLVGPPSDVYSIGAMLYHLLTGRAPFLAETPMATLRKVMEEEPVAPSKLNSKTPPDLETICLKCLEKKPERRYATARGLAEELGRFLNNEPILAKPANPLRKAWSWSLHNPWIITASASAVILGLVGLAYYLWQRTAFSEWRLSHPNQTPRYTLGLLESAGALYSILVASMTLMSLPWFDLMTRRRRGNPILRYHLAAYSVIGSLEVALGIFLVLKWAEATAWRWPSIYVWYGYPLTLVEAFSFSSFGMLVVWEAAREHFRAVSGIASQESPKPDHGIEINWKTAPLTLFSEIATVTGMPQAEWKIGSVTMRSGALIVGVFWCAMLGATWLVSRGWWWAWLVVSGTALSWAMAMCGATKGSARLYWVFIIVVMAGICMAPEYGWAKRRNFQSWIIGIAAGFFLAKVSMPRHPVECQDSGSPEATEPSPQASGLAHALNRGSFEVLRFLGAVASFAMFFVLLVPDGSGSRDWFTVVMGISSLSMAAWCMTLRSARPSSVSLLVLIFILGWWIIIASPYGFPHGFGF